MKKIPFELHTEVYTPKDIAKVLSLAVDDKNFTGNNKGENFLNGLNTQVVHVSIQTI